MIKHGKWLILIILVLTVSACGAANSSSSSADAPQKGKNEKISTKMVTFQSENGPVKVPAHPKRVVVLSTFAGNVLALDTNIVGVSRWAKMNPLFQEKLKDVAVVSDDNLEKIIELQPDLIIGLSNTKNIDKLKKIAPTVTFTYGKLNYLKQHLAIARLLGKEEQAKKWIQDFEQRAEALGEKVRAKIGEDATVTVIETFNKQLYVFGNNWARGTEILYQEMKLEMPKKVKEVALEQGFHAISPEVLPQFVGDYLIISLNPDADPSFLKTDVYQQIPAVQKGHVFKVNAKKFYFNDPISLEYQLDFFRKAFLDVNGG